MKLYFQEFHLSTHWALDSRQSSTITVTSSRASSKTCALFVSGPKIQVSAFMILSGTCLLEGPLLVNLLAIHRLAIHLSNCLRLTTAGPTVAIQGWLYLCDATFCRRTKKTAGPLVCRQKYSWSTCLWFKTERLLVHLSTYFAGDCCLHT